MFIGQQVSALHNVCIFNRHYAQELCILYNTVLMRLSKATRSNCFSRLLKNVHRGLPITKWKSCRQCINQPHEYAGFELSYRQISRRVWKTDPLFCIVQTMWHCMWISNYWLRFSPVQGKIPRTAIQTIPSSYPLPFHTKTWTQMESLASNFILWSYDI